MNSGSNVALQGSRLGLASRPLPQFHSQALLVEADRRQGSGFDRAVNPVFRKKMSSLLRVSKGLQSADHALKGRDKLIGQAIEIVPGSQYRKCGAGRHERPIALGTQLKL